MQFHKFLARYCSVCIYDGPDDRSTVTFPASMVLIELMLASDVLTGLDSWSLGVKFLFLVVALRLMSSLTSLVLAYTLDFSHTTLCFNKNRVSRKISVLPSGTIFPKLWT